MAVETVTERVNLLHMNRDTCTVALSQLGKMWVHQCMHFPADQLDWSGILERSLHMMLHFAATPVCCTCCWGTILFFFWRCLQDLSSYMDAALIVVNFSAPPLSSLQIALRLSFPWQDPSVHLCCHQQQCSTWIVGPKSLPCWQVHLPSHLTTACAVSEPMILRLV